MELFLPELLDGGSFLERGLEPERYLAPECGAEWFLGPEFEPEW